MTHNALINDIVGKQIVGSVLNLRCQVKLIRLLDTKVWLYNFISCTSK